MSNPTKPTDVGMNQTGIKLHKGRAAVIEGAEQGVTRIAPDSTSVMTVRAELGKLMPPIGTMPPPGNLKGAAKAAMSAMTGKHPMVFLDMLGERLAFERSGTRLYEALLSKLDAADPHPGGPSREDLERIRDEELAHFAMLTRAMEKMGGDPTAITPSADIVAVQSLGLVQVLTDPRVTLTEGLKAILTAELIDNDCWLVLSDVAERLGEGELASEFRQALIEEEDHLMRVRGWLGATLDGQLGLERDDASTVTVPAPGI